MFKLLVCVILAISAASACDYAPGATLKTTTTYTVGRGRSEGLLSSAEKDVIRTSWEKMRRNGKLAPQILLRFLQAYPEYQKKFTTFADVPQSELMRNGNFLAQAFTIMAGLNVVVQSLSVPELLQAEAAHLGKTHFTRGVTVPQFEQFARSALDTLRDVGRANEEQLQAWERGLSALIAQAGKALKNADDVPHVLTGLTPRQIKDVQRTWNNLRGDRNAVATSVFVKLFTANPSLKSKFDAFADVAVSDLPSNAAFNAQVTKVADRLDSMISVLDKPLKISGQVRYMAFSHKIRAVLRAEFQDFVDVLVSKLASKGISDGDLSSWKAVLNNLANAIGKIQSL